MAPSSTWQPVAEALIGTPEFDTADVVREAGVDLAFAQRLWQALGFPPVAVDERSFTRADIEILRAVRLLLEQQITDRADLLQLTRVIGQSLARVADAQVTVVAERLMRAHRDESSEDAEAAASWSMEPAELVARFETLAPTLERFLAYIWRRHLLAAVLRLSAMPSPADRTLTVGFADLVGFTAYSQALDARELAAMVDQFETTSYEHIVAHGGRVVKMIGDEVMFAADDGAVAAESALALVEAHARDDAPLDVRVGLACGPSLAWEGDLYGPTVNLASRLVNLALPGTGLVSEELGEQLRDIAGLALRQLRPVRLQGIGRVRPWVLRRG